MNTIEIIQPEVIPTVEISEAVKSHNDYANSLRMIADWIQAHPEMPLPEKELRIFNFDGKEQFAIIAKAMKTFKKDYLDSMIYLTKEFGCFTVQAVEYREKVCERVVVGTKKVIEQKVIKYEEVEVDQEIVEWKCTDARLLGTSQVKEIENGA